jgi:hypothetical protein
VVNRAQPAAPTSVAPTSSEFTPPAQTDPAPTVPAEVPARPSAPLGILPGSPAASAGSDLRGAPTDSASLALALSGLSHPAPVRPPDRRGVAFMAIALLAADGALIAALRRRGLRLPFS